MSLDIAAPSVVNYPFTEMGATRGDNMAKTFELPPMDTAYFCDGVVLTLGEMIGDMDADLIPATQEDFDWLLFCFGEGVPETQLEQRLGVTL